MHHLSQGLDNACCLWVRYQIIHQCTAVSIALCEPNRLSAPDQSSIDYNASTHSSPS